MGSIQRAKDELGREELTLVQATTVARACIRDLEAVVALHSPRKRSGHGYTLMWCRECGQDWPCATGMAIGEEH